MPGEPLLTLLLAGIAAAHLLVLVALALRAWWRAPAGEAAHAGDASDRRDASEAAAAEEAADGGVVCPHCETTNEAGYRYCRACVGELPGGAPTAPTASPVGDGNLL